MLIASSSCLKSECVQIRALLEHYDAEPRVRELARNDSARSAGADDDEVDFIGGRVGNALLLIGSGLTHA